MRHGKPDKAMVRTGNTRVLVRMPSKPAEIQAVKSISALHSKDAMRLQEEMSRSLWSSLNPGYKQQEPERLCSMASTDYVWNEQEVRPRDIPRSTDTAGLSTPTSA